ncbi:MAG: hypothetical protein ACRCW3_02035, partial [Metamycoplasmataceae bacterium]
MNLIYIILIVSSIIIIIPWLYGLILPIIKPTISTKSTMYLYAFSSGFFIILAIFGFYAEAKEELTVHLEDLNYSQGAIWGINVGIIGGVSFVILGLSILVKYLVGKKIAKNDLASDHNHSHLIYNLNDVNPKSKILALLLLLSHRIPGGLIIGFLIASIQRNNEVSLVNIIFLITFLLHIIPEELVLYYRQMEMGVNKWRAALYSFLGTSLLIPFIFIGAYSSEALMDNVIFISFLKVCVGSLILFSALVEFFPEFLHNKMDAKTWYITISLLMLGIVFGLILFSVHSHQYDENGHDHLSTMLYPETRKIIDLSSI